MTHPLWKLNRVTLAGRGRSRLENVSLEIPVGITAILGPSGAGKSSLLNLLVEFEAPTHGTVSRLTPVNPQVPPAGPLAPQPPGHLPLFWSPPDNGLWPHLTVAAHLTTVLPAEAVAQGESERLLSAFDLKDKSSAFPDQLSQGEAARLAVARGLAANPAVLVLDEPLVHVDQAGSWKYWAVVRRWLDESGSSLVFSTHSPEIVMREADQVICLDEGRITFKGIVPELYERPSTSELAWSLGPVNWFAPADGLTWLDRSLQESVSCRPERLAWQVSTESPLVVTGSRSTGLVAELELLDERSGNRRKFFHRPAGQPPRQGDRIILQILGLLLVCLFAIGCAEGNAAPALPVGGFHSWMLPAEGASIPAPRAVHSTDEGEVFVLDNGGRVLVYDEKGALLRRWWMPDYSIGKPEKIVRLKDGRLAVADTHYHRVVFFDNAGEVTGMFGSLGHEPGQFIYPVAVVEDDVRNLYVAEYGDNDRVQKFSPEGEFLLQFGRPGTSSGEFQRPSGMVWRVGKLYVVDAFNNRIQVFSDAGEFLEVLGGEDGTLHYPYDIALSPSDELFVVEYAGGRVSKFNLEGKLLGRYGEPGSAEGQFSNPWGMTVSPSGMIFVADTGNRRMVKLEQIGR